MSILEGVQQVLQLFADGATDLSFTEVTEQLGIPRSSASRLLNQMLHHGLLQQNVESRRYQPSLLLARVAHTRQTSTPLDIQCGQSLTRLSAESGLTAYLSTLIGGDTVVLQRLNGTHPVQVLSSPGSRRKATGTAMGRSMLARLPEDVLMRYYPDAKTARIYPGDDSSPQTLYEVLEGIRQQCHAVVIDQAMPGIGAIAAAIQDPATQELRCLCISFAAFSVPTEQVEHLQQLLLREVGMLGRNLNDPLWLNISQ